jgi:hypothetical protein
VGRAVVLLAAGGAPDVRGKAVVSDPRHIANGRVIPSEGYADQPYIVKADDGAWVCAITTGRGVEGAAGQHVITMRSTDQGRSWSSPVDVEPSNGPEASYAVMLKTPYGRLYCFYNHNTDNVREVKREDGGVYKRVDSLGYYVFKYSDDHGRSWSAKRFPIPVREFECDRRNVYGGRLRFFWNVGRPLVLGKVAMLVLHKVGAMGPGFFAQSEGAFLRSENLLTEREPEKITFETLPEGDVGLRTPPGGARVAEEQSLTSLSDGSLYCVYRTIDGWPACSYSRDGGRHWTVPACASYAPGGRRIKHPRAANFVWRCANGRFLYWFHNHGGAVVRTMPEWGAYDDRNPAWIAAGIERDSREGRVIHWSQPEILLYEDDPFIRMSYPDLVEEGGRFYVTETQKSIGRLHEIPKTLLDGLFNQWDNRTVAAAGRVLDLPGNRSMPREAPMPRLPEFHQRDAGSPDYRGKDLRSGFSLDLWLKLDSLAAGQILLDSRDAAGRGILLTATDERTLRLSLNDGRSESSWDSDRIVVMTGTLQHVAAMVDGGPKIITFVVNGVLCDGGDDRQFGWGRFSPSLRAPNGSKVLHIAPRMNGAVRVLRIYNRPLRTSEAVGNFRAGPGVSAADPVE